MIDTDGIEASLVRLMPTGRAWQSRDGAVKKEKSVLRQITRATAVAVTPLETAMTAALDEFFPDTASVDLDAWYADYGLPDESDPFGTNLPAKVRFTGGVSLDYYAELVQAMGWAVQLRWLTGNDAELPGVVSTLRVTVDSANSPSFGTEIEVDTATVEQDFLGDPSAAPLIAALDRVIPAHCAISYTVI